MKLFSIFNKPALKAGNKQGGIVFLEYVIMAFIITVAVICALWWLYWHLQQMTWEIKGKLDTLKILTCPMEPPNGAAPGDQPTPQPQGFHYKFTGDGVSYWTSPPNEIYFPNQKITVKYVSGAYDPDPLVIIGLYDSEGTNLEQPSPGDKMWYDSFFVGQTREYTYTHSGSGPYRVGLYSSECQFGCEFEVTVTPY